MRTCFFSARGTGRSFLSSIAKAQSQFHLPQCRLTIWCLTRRMLPIFSSSSRKTDASPLKFPLNKRSICSFSRCVQIDNVLVRSLSVWRTEENRHKVFEALTFLAHRNTMETTAKGLCEPFESQRQGPNLECESGLYTYVIAVSKVICRPV